MTPADASIRWLERPPDGAPPILQQPVNSRVVYQVTIPRDARVVARCDLFTDSDQDATPGTVVEFAITASVDGCESTVSCRVSSGGPRRGQGDARHLSLHLSQPGLATVALTTRTIGTPHGLHARWHNPRVEWRRPSGDLTRVIREAIRHRSAAPIGDRRAAIGGERLYRLWVREHEPSRRTLRAQRATAGKSTRRFTVVTVAASDATAVSRMRASLLAQSDPHWEWLLLTTAAAPAPDRDPRIRLISIPDDLTAAARLNRALEEAGGELVGLVGEHDALAPTAFFEMARAAERSPAVEVLYSDEDRIGDDGVRSTPVFKPDWSPELLLARNYIGRLSLFRVAAVLAAGGFRDGFDGAEEWELFLRLSRAAAGFKRVAACLYHRRQPDGPDVAARDAVLRDHGCHEGLEWNVRGGADAARIHWAVQGTPLVSVIIPNRNAAAVLKTCVDGLLDGTSYARRELIIVDNGSTEAAVLDIYASIERRGAGRIVAFNRPFNFSAACNAGAAAAAGDLLLFLNNDIEVIEPDWMEELVRWAQRPGIGVVGAKLLYPDRLIQHAGVVFGLGLVGHIFARAADGSTGVFGSTDWYRNYLAVTGACQMMSREVFQRVGGFDERLRLSFSDVILCMEARKAGYRTVYTPHARLDPP